MCDKEERLGSTGINYYFCNTHGRYYTNNVINSKYCGLYLSIRKNKIIKIFNIVKLVNIKML